MSDGSGNLVATYSYDEFGNLTASTGTLYNPLRYSGANNAYFDSETGLYKMGARYYRPEIGRWITRDAYSGQVEKPQTQNKYVYCSSNPVNRSDASGYWDMNWHSWWTKDAARRAGFSESIAQAMGRGAHDIDYAPWMLSNHFDLAWGNGLKNDSRWQHQVQLLYAGIWLWKHGLPGLGSYWVGWGLHQYPQDYIAHGYIRPDQHKLFGYGRWAPYSPDKIRWPGDPNYGRRGHPRNGIWNTSIGWPAYNRRVPSTVYLTRKLVDYYYLRVVGNHSW